MLDLLAIRLRILSDMEQLKAGAESAANEWRNVSKAAIEQARAVGVVDLPADPGPDFQKAVRRYVRTLDAIVGRHCDKLRELEQSTR